MPSNYICPNAATCNFHRAATAFSNPKTDILLQAYCFNASKGGTCLRSLFVRSSAANLSPEIAPNATIVPPLAGLAKSNDMAADLVARIYSRPTA